ncbi:MAG: phosphotransferase [Actinomycetota bacterium]|nr:phosphotransferase [Actinomycetota bacterium]
MTVGHPERHDAYRALLADYLRRRRWFAGKGRDFTVPHVHALPWFEGVHAPADFPRSRLEFVTAEFSDGTADTYQLPVAYLPNADPGLEHALIGAVDHPDLGDVVAYDAVYVKETTTALFAGFLAARDGSTVHDQSGLEFHTVEGSELPDSAPMGTVMPAEQSNTSIVYGEDAILKLFRRVTEGNNPDIEIHDALTRAGFENVAPLLGWLRGRWSGPDGAPRVADLGMLQVFLRTATDGWDIALASVRDLLDEEDLHPGEVGGDFAGESERLGEAVAGVHQELARLFPTGSAADEGGETLATAMQARLGDAVNVVPELTEFQPALSARFDRLRSMSEPVPTQRVHGDLHLGQTLRTVKGWKIIDFEGEPAKTLTERSSLSSPLRDVAGMLRSFDYAAGVTLQGFGVNSQLSYRAEEWNARNRRAFLAGYVSVAGDEVSAHSDLLAAFEADKAIYEAVYETRNRPTWVGIPLHAIARITAEE